MTRLFTALFLMSFFVVGCGSSNEPTVIGVKRPVIKEDDIPAQSPNIVYPTDWLEVTINANSAKTLVTTVAHFNTSRNACGKEAYGALDLEAWNGFVKNMNAAIAQALTVPVALVDEYCVSPPDSNAEGYMPKYVDDSLHVKTEKRTITLYENREGQICSKIKDRTLSDQLLLAINKIIIAADKEDCPNGWGSALR